MSEVLSRLFPAIRDVRTPLIVGCVWFTVIAFALALSNREIITEPASQSDDPVVRLLNDMSSHLPGWVVVAAIALMATIVGSGVVRLMDRMRQAFRFPANPEEDGLEERCERPDEVRGFLQELDLYAKAPPLDDRLRQLGRRLHRSDGGTPDSPLDRDRSYLVAAHIRCKPDGDPARREWGGPEEPVAVFRDDLRLFLFHLARDERFDGYNDQQLLRFSLIPPVGLAVVLCLAWLRTGADTSKFLLLASLVGFLSILYIDRFRLRSLLIDRWRSLADEYPTWLPAADLDRRNLGRERVREILHGDAGIRSVAAHQEALRSDVDQAVLRKRLAVLRATSTQLRLSGAPLMADALEAITRDDTTVEQRFDEFYRLAARWSGSRIEHFSKPFGGPGSAGAHLGPADRGAPPGEAAPKFSNDTDPSRAGSSQRSSQYADDSEELP